MDFPVSIAVSGHRDVSLIVKMPDRGLCVVRKVPVSPPGDKPAGLTRTAHVAQACFILTILCVLLTANTLSMTDIIK